MGLYDCRCMVTGVSLKGADAVLVALQRPSDVYSPISLGIKGNYNRMGSIDGIEEDANSGMVLDFFRAGLQTGDFVVDEEYLIARRYYPISTIETLLQAFERNINDNPRAALLGGPPVVFSLISRSVWDGIAGTSPSPEAPAMPTFQEMFRESPVAGRIYSGSPAEVADHVREFAAVCSFMASRGMAWKPADDPGQDYAEDMREYLAEARRSFSDSAMILTALLAYEGEVGDLLEDDD